MTRERTAYLAGTAKLLDVEPLNDHAVRLTLGVGRTCRHIVQPWMWADKVVHYCFHALCAFVVSNN